LDKLEKQLEDFRKAIGRLEEALNMAAETRGGKLYPFLRDSAIQRFEFTFEIFWKLVKAALRQLEGVECNSPKSCMRELFRNKYVEESELEKLLEMVDDRNLTVHTYHEEIAEELLGKLKGYAILMRSVVEGIEDAHRSP